MKNLSQPAGLTLAGILLIVNSAVFSSEDKHREHGAHEHGSAQLNIVIEENQIHIELETPAMNIVGFEHVPHNHEQKQAIKDATNKLKKGNKQFILTPAAQCSLSKVHVESPALESNKHKTEEESHSEFHANYEFQCKDIAKLKEIDVQLFKTFSATNDIDVQLISNSGQTEKELSSGNHKLILEP